MYNNKIKTYNQEFKNINLKYYNQLKKNIYKFIIKILKRESTILTLYAYYIIYTLRTY